jgi:NlpC/P60 family
MDVSSAGQVHSGVPFLSNPAGTTSLSQPAQDHIQERKVTMSIRPTDGPALCQTTNAGTRSDTGHSPRRRPRRAGAAALLAAAAAALAGSAALAAPAMASQPPSVLAAGQALNAGNSLVSPGGAFSLVMQTDGNLVEYGPGGPMWSSNTPGSGGSNRLVMQTDGNLVMYTASGGVPFATGEVGSGSSDYLSVQDDGNVVQYGNGGAVFATKSSTERAIQWFYTHMGSTTYEGECELAVENSFGTSRQYLTAIDDWNARPQKHLNSAAAPRGTLVFYKTSTSGHVTISLGNGTVISTSAPGYKIGISPITGWFSPLLGWAPSPW